ncbi:helicase SKI2W-like [Anneissia japonica]|uniref:helicase SKI2W-like n=1 Tax=Anneissia japonica TaxID=1529436 RepID=UPI001425AFD2|nr:helicase SKI2W-like [Anneissia japonica]
MDQEAGEDPNVSQERNYLEEQLSGYKCCQCRHLRMHYETFENQQILKEEIAKVEEELSERPLLLLPQFQQRQKVLKSLRYLNNDMEIQQKGIVACKFSHHEIILTEIIFGRILDDLRPEEIAAVLSCIVYNGEKESMVTEAIKKKIQAIQNIAKNIAAHEKKYNKEFDVKDYVEQFKPGFADVVFEWASGKEFEDIIKLAGRITEGEIVNKIQQLINTCREMHDACIIINRNSRFAVMVNAASNLLKRDIFTVPSLYIA